MAGKSCEGSITAVSLGHSYPDQASNQAERRVNQAGDDVLRSVSELADEQR